MIGRRSRYAKTNIVELQGPDGELLRLLDVRSVPSPGADVRMLEVVVPADARLDRLAHRHYRDAAQFWRICDAADVLDPFDLLAVGERIAIPIER